MKTLDTNPAHGLALVMHDWPGIGFDFKFELVALADAPPLENPLPLAPVYIRQAHYVVSHVAVGLGVHDLDVPKDGWKYKR